MSEIYLMTRSSKIKHLEWCLHIFPSEYKFKKNVYWRNVHNTTIMFKLSFFDGYNSKWYTLWIMYRCGWHKQFREVTIFFVVKNELNDITIWLFLPFVGGVCVCEWIHIQLTIRYIRYNAKSEMDVT